MKSVRLHLEQLPARDNPAVHGELADFHPLHADADLGFMFEQEATAHIAEEAGSMRLDVHGLLHPVDAHIVVDGKDTIVHLSPGNSSIDIGKAVDVYFTDLNEETGHVAPKVLEDGELPIAIYGVAVEEVGEWYHQYMEQFEREEKLKHALLHGAHHDGVHADHGHAAHVPHAEHGHAEHKHEGHEHSHEHEEEEKGAEETKPETSGDLYEGEMLHRKGVRHPAAEAHDRPGHGMGEKERADDAKPELAPMPRDVTGERTASDDDIRGLFWGIDLHEESYRPSFSKESVVQQVSNGSSVDTGELVAVAAVTALASPAPVASQRQSFWSRAKHWLMRA